MHADKILFPVDFSKGDETALKLATSLARDLGASLLIVHVEESPLAYGGGEMYYGTPEPAVEDLREMLAAVVPADPNVSYEHRLLTGSPASVVSRLVDEEEIDMIVMSTHGRTGISRILMGSVAEAIVRHAKCPVLTVKQPNKMINETES